MASATRQGLKRVIVSRRYKVASELREVKSLSEVKNGTKTKNENGESSRRVDD